MAKKASKKGGSRPGAGRPPSGKESRKITICAKVTPSLAEKFTAKAKALGMTKSAAITEAIRRFVG